MKYDLSNRRHLTIFPIIIQKISFRSLDLLNKIRRLVHQLASSSNYAFLCKQESLPHQHPLPLAHFNFSPHLEPRPLQLLSHLPFPRPLKFISHRPHHPLAFAFAIYSPTSSRSPFKAPSTSGSSTSHSPRSSGSISSSQFTLFSSSSRDSQTNVPLPDNFQRGIIMHLYFAVCIDYHYYLE